MKLSESSTNSADHLFVLRGKWQFAVREQIYVAYLFHRKMEGKRD